MNTPVVAVSTSTYPSSSTSNLETKLLRLTRTATRIFHVPTAAVSLVAADGDAAVLERGGEFQLHHYGTGLEDSKNGRDLCTQAWGVLTSKGVPNREEMLIVPDTSCDARFPAFFCGRYSYTGIVLRSSAGHVLGLLSLLEEIDSPGQGQVEPCDLGALNDLALLAVDLLQAADSSRDQFLLDAISHARACHSSPDHLQHPAHPSNSPQQASLLVECTAHQLLTPLMGIQLSLSLLLHDQAFMGLLQPRQLESLRTAFEATELMGRKCHATLASLRGRSGCHEDTGNAGFPIPRRHRSIMVAPTPEDFRQELVRGTTALHHDIDNAVLVLSEKHSSSSRFSSPPFATRLAEKSAPIRVPAMKPQDESPAGNARQWHPPPLGSSQSLPDPVFEQLTRDNRTSPFACRSHNTGKVAALHQQAGVVPSGKLGPRRSCLRRRRALVIEDSVVLQKTLKRALSNIGFDHVEIARDGLEGLRALQLGTFDFTLCDFSMPRMDGSECVQLYRQWEQEHGHLQQYIVGMSAHANAKDIARGIEVGMNAFEPKPISLVRLCELMESHPVRLVQARLDRMFIHSESVAEATELS